MNKKQRNIEMIHQVHFTLFFLYQNKTYSITDQSFNSIFFFCFVSFSAEALLFVRSVDDGTNKVKQNYS